MRANEQPYKALIFDAEGVIIDTEGFWDEVSVRFLGRFGLAYDRAFLKHRLTGRSLAEGVAVMRELYDLPGEVAELTELRRAVAKEVFAQDAAFVPGFQEAYTELSALCPCCVATAMDPALFAACDAALRITELFKGRVVTLSDVGDRGKPAPDLFLAAARRLGTPPEHCLVIEDAPLGVQAAKNAAMACLALATTYPTARLTEEDPDAIHATWAEARTWLLEPGATGSVFL